MKFGPQLEQEQTLKLNTATKLTLTPVMRQAIEILQFSSIELLEYLKKQQEENPLIELQELHQHIHSVPLQERKEQRDSSNWVEQTIAPVRTLQEQLLEQVREMMLTPEMFRVCRFLIGCIDERGYLDMPEEEAAERLAVSRELVAEGISQLQTLEPAGVGARNLQECLLLQLKRRSEGPLQQLAGRIVEEALEELAEGKLPSMAERFQVSVTEMQQASDLIRRLNPHPGLATSYEMPQYLIPDVRIEKVAGRYVVLVNDSWLPHFHINRDYQAMLQNDDEGIHLYLKGKLNAALWIARSIEQRRMTLYRVAECLAAEQQEFLEKGPAYLLPLTLNDVAEKLDLHESTVSRAVNGKYAQTPQGMIALKGFFSHGIGASEIPVERIKLQLKMLIEREDRHKPLSDQKLADKLTEQGFCISRRTVAKYREELGIPSSSRRKRFE